MSENSWDQLLEAAQQCGEFPQTQFELCMHIFSALAALD